MDNRENWIGVAAIAPRNFRCGYSDCGREVSSEKGWHHAAANVGNDGIIATCPVCKRPTFFDIAQRTQLPGVSLGNDVGELPPGIKKIWSEIRSSTSQGSYTSAVLLGRKLLMHIAVNAGAQAGESFVSYVDFLVENHYAPPNSTSWIDKIRSHSNEANHEIVLKSNEDAEEIMIFLEMLLKFIYEFPARAGVKAATPTAKP